MDSHDVERVIESLEAVGPSTPATVAEVHPADIADALAELDETAQRLVFSLLGDDKAAEVLVEADENTQPRLMRLLSGRVPRLLNVMDPDDAADLLELLPEAERETIEAGLDADVRRSVRLLGEYEPESAGGIMTTEVVVVSSDDSLQTAGRKLGDAELPEAMGGAFVVDPAGTLVGVVPLTSLLGVDLEGRVADVMNADVISVPVDADQEEVARLVEHYELPSVPVVDAAGRLKGVITVDDIIEVLDEEASEDMLRMAGTGAVHPTTQPLLSRLAARAPWLSVTLAGTFAAGLVIEFIEKTYFTDAASSGDATFRALLYFIPLIGGMAGNVGSQSSTIMVRGFATGEIDARRPSRVLRSEVALALLIGLISGLLVGVAAALVHGDMPWLGLVVGLALPCAVTVAGLAGTLLPFACERTGVDPAYAAGPFLLTLNDLAAYLIYFAVAVGLMDALGIR